ncbi:MAG: carbohydrate kinase family protein [Vicinamibacterales bacterium]
MRFCPLLPSTGSVDIAVFGENSLDFVALESLDAPIAQKKTLRGFERHVGGQAATAAVACARQGVRVRYAGVFGTDDWGEVVRAQLAREGVSVAAIEHHQSASRIAVVIVDPAGERMVYEYRDPRLRLADPAPVVAAVSDSRILLLDATDLAVSIACAESARRAGIRTIVDVDRVAPETEALLRLIDVIIAPEAFVLAYSGAATVEAGLHEMFADLRPAVVVATLGPRGSVAVADELEVRTPGFVVSTVDTTGAGDAFRGGFASAWIRAGHDANLDALLDAANATAALNCRAVGAQTALPGLQEVQALVTESGSARSN